MKSRDISDEMIKEFKDMVQNNKLVIQNQELFNSLSFIKLLDIKVLQLIQCKLHLQPDLNNKSIVELMIKSCELKTVEGLQLRNLDVLNLSDNKLTSIQNIKNFAKLKV
ncbi:Leucine-rich_repeat domain superfamily [Hexamita inflata]|uniref:Leucine-rich repeat domain superfamily n=1 Tax=Hexamita inflata TaxID=28002 RepID=A0AA86V5X9_9EUKA|nr:Leucine-rich repeat domain superfamily [Hexamita inflata]